MGPGIVAVALALTIAGEVAPAAPPDPNARYKELVAAYAAGDRAAAVAGIGDLDDDALRAGVESLRGAPPRLLLAALMMHTDRRLLEDRTPDIEAPQGCRSAQTNPSRRTVEHLILHVDGIGLARRWTIAIALQDQWDGCFADAQAWIDAGARWFAGDAEVALTRGAIYETFAMLPSLAPSPFASVGRSRWAGFGAQADRKRQLGEARRSLERAVTLDPALDRARLRLARVLWHIGKGEEGRASLETVIARSRDGEDLHLAHLFLARVHQDARRDEAALSEYRAALALQPDSMAAALGLADALRAVGQAEAARDAVEAALAVAGRSHERQAFWEYRTADARQGSRMLDALRDESGP